MKKIVNRVLLNCTDDELIQMDSAAEGFNATVSEEARRDVRVERSRLLSDTDWMALSDSTMTPEWATYRQALRDITGQSGFPYDVVWPVKP